MEPPATSPMSFSSDEGWSLDSVKCEPPSAVSTSDAIGNWQDFLGDRPMTSDNIANAVMEHTRHFEAPKYVHFLRQHTAYRAKLTTLQDIIAVGNVAFTHLVQCRSPANCR